MSVHIVAFQSLLRRRNQLVSRGLGSLCLLSSLRLVLALVLAVLASHVLLHLVLVGKLAATLATGERHYK